jgi:hypothetical protein
MDMEKGLGCWKTMPILRRTDTGSTFVIVDVRAHKVNFAFEAKSSDQIVHAVDTFQAPCFCRTRMVR